MDESGESRRIEIQDTAIMILGSGGSKALTHRAIDASLGIASGSTSNYFRTRRALLEGALERLVKLDLEELTRIEAAVGRGSGDPAKVSSVIEGILRLWISDPRHLVRHRARLELFLSSTTIPQLKVEVDAFRVEMREAVAQLLINRDVPRPELAAELIVAMGDGLLMDAFLSERDHVLEILDLIPMVFASWTGD